MSGLGKTSAIASKPPTGAGQLFKDAFGGADLASATIQALQAFANISSINNQAKQYLSNVFQNYWYHIGLIQQNLADHNINRAQAARGVQMWNDARDSAIIGYQSISAASAQAATNAAMQAVISIVGAALNAAIKAAL
jgi:hypothetical protein